MGGLKAIYAGMAEIVGQAEANLASKVNGIASGEMGGDVDAVDVADADGADSVAGGEGGDDLSTQELIALQYDVQRFSIFNNMATSTMQTVAGAYQSVTGNLNFR